MALRQRPSACSGQASRPLDDGLAQPGCRWERRPRSGRGAVGSQRWLWREGALAIHVRWPCGTYLTSHQAPGLEANSWVWNPRNRGTCRSPQGVSVDRRLWDRQVLPCAWADGTGSSLPHLLAGQSRTHPLPLTAGKASCRHHSGVCVRGWGGHGCWVVRVGPSRISVSSGHSASESSCVPARVASPMRTLQAPMGPMFW